MIGDRREDLSKVFDRRWKANHNEDLKEAKVNEKKFVNKMFNISDRENQNPIKPLTPSQRAESLHNNMNNAFIGQRKVNINNIVKKWK